jgi:AcrR family transcriptional regulator
LSGNRAPGRPPAADLEERLVAAAVSLVETTGTINAITIEALCAAAGASKASFYRRWAHRDAFLADLLGKLRAPPMTPEEYSDLRSDLIRLLHDVLGLDFRRTRMMTLAMISGGAASQQLVLQHMTEHIIPRRSVFIDRLRHAVATGDLAPDTDLWALHDLLTAPVLKFLVFVESLDPPRPDFIPRLVDQALRGALR